MNKGIKFYETAIHKFLGNSVIKRLEEIHFKNDEEVRQRLLPDTSIGQGEWVDISGLIAPKTEIERLMSDIETGVLHTVDQIHDRFAEMHANYYTYEWTWAYGKTAGVLRTRCRNNNCKGYYKHCASMATVCGMAG